MRPVKLALELYIMSTWIVGSTSIRLTMSAGFLATGAAARAPPAKRAKVVSRALRACGMRASRMSCLEYRRLPRRGCKPWPEVETTPGLYFSRSGSTLESSHSCHEGAGDGESDTDFPHDRARRLYEPGSPPGGSAGGRD